jgi:hypothetical protein
MKYPTGFIENSLAKVGINLPDEELVKLYAELFL